jgi:hypothetical protein
MESRTIEKSCGFFVFGFFNWLSVRFSPPHPSPLPQGGEGEREPIGGYSSPEFDLIFQVGVPRIVTAVSPLSLWERARVRGKGADRGLFKT